MDEAISPMAIATRMQNAPTSSQPHVITTGPPLLNPMKYEVRQPARMEMIVNEMAKFENPPISRYSTWAYPRRCSSASSECPEARS